MMSKCGKNKKVAHRCGRGCHWCSYHILMSSVIYYWTICFIIYRFSQALKWSLHFFFPRTSLMNNTLPRPGLEPRSSDLEPSALTTGLLNKAVALVCPQYSWPCTFKVARCMVVHPNFLVWWVTTILYNYGAILCELHYNKELKCTERKFFHLWQRVLYLNFIISESGESLRTV